MLNDLSIGTDTSRAFGEFVRTNTDAKASLGRMEFSVQVSLLPLSQLFPLPFLLDLLPTVTSTLSLSSVQVLTTGNWPTYKVMDLNLPPVMQRCVQFFQQYYNMEVSALVVMQRYLTCHHLFFEITDIADVLLFRRTFYIVTVTPPRCSPCLP